MAWKGRSAAPYFLSLTLFFIASGILIPQILAPIEKVWMALARVLSVVMTYVILTLTFYLVITPMGLLVRILGKDLLKLKFKTDEPSYWIKVDPEGPCSHPEKPY